MKKLLEIRLNALNADRTSLVESLNGLDPNSMNFTIAHTEIRNSILQVDSQVELLMHRIDKLSI